MKSSEVLKTEKSEELVEKSEIVKALNDYGKIVFEVYEPLEINDEQLDIIFYLVDERVKFIKNYIIENSGDQALGLFVLFAYRALFVGKFDLKCENLDKKMKYFHLLLNFIKYKKMQIIEKKLIQYLKELENDINNKVLKLFEKVLQNNILYFIYLILRTNDSSVKEINELIIRGCQSFCNIKLNFNYDELKDINHDSLINDLYEMFFIKKITNNFIMTLINGHIIFESMTNDELLEIINMRSKNSKEKEKISLIDNITEKNKQGELINKNEIHPKNTEQLLKKQQEIIIFLLKQINLDKVEISNLKAELNLIKLRRSLKVLANYIYLGLNLDGEFTYDSKVKKIVEKLNSFKSKEFDKNLVDKTKQFMNFISYKVNLGNVSAHNVNMDASIIDQIFDLFDRKNHCENFKNKLKKSTNADEIIKKLVKNYEDNFFNKTKLKYNEKIIEESIDDLSGL